MKQKHNYSTLADVIRAMLDGVVFYCTTDKDATSLTFDSSIAANGGNPFRYNGVRGVVMEGVWDGWTGWAVDAEWYDNIPEGGVLCWVSDFDKTDRLYAETITFYDDAESMPYRSTDSIYHYATPVKPSECMEV